MCSTSSPDGEHIAFIVALILWGRRLWPLVGVVTAFTLAHSVTLSLAVLEVVDAARQAGGDVRRAVDRLRRGGELLGARPAPALVAGGLCSGSSTASVSPRVLRDYGLPRDALLPALAAFNAGVELGQIAVVLAVMSVFAAFGWAARGASPISASCWGCRA